MQLLSSAVKGNVGKAQMDKIVTFFWSGRLWKMKESGNGPEHWYDMGAGFSYSDESILLGEWFEQDIDIDNS